MTGSGVRAAGISLPPLQALNSHVLLYEKYLLDLSIRYSGYQIKSMSWRENQNFSFEQLPSKPFNNKRLLKYLSKDNKELEFDEYCKKFRFF